MDETIEIVNSESHTLRKLKIQLQELNIKIDVIIIF